MKLNEIDETRDISRKEERPTCSLKLKKKQKRDESRKNSIKHVKIMLKRF